MQRHIGTMQLTLTLPAITEFKDGWHIASCGPLDVQSQGRTVDEAFENLGEALGLFIESCAERGTLLQVLKDCGLSVEQQVVSLPETPPDEGVRWMNVPLSLVARDSAEAHAH